MTSEQIAFQLVTVCQSGFANEFQWKGWLRKHWDEIVVLPEDLKDQVIASWVNATAREFSEGSTNRVSRRSDGPSAGVGPSTSNGDRK